MERVELKTWHCRRPGKTITALCLLAAVAMLGGAGCGGEEDVDPINDSGQRITCKVTIDCSARGGTCKKGVCVADNECKTSADCAAGQVCLPDKDFTGLCGTPGKPAVPGPAWSCVANKDCPTGQQCTAGKCELPPATAAKEICGNGKDDDGDGKADCKDLDCEREPACQKTPPVKKCGGKPCPCDVLKQNCTTSGYRCWPGGPYAKDGMCYPIGPLAEGAACVEPPVDGPKACGKGLVCVGTQSSGGICSKLCGTSADCKKTQACKKLGITATGTVDYGACVAVPPPPPPPPPPPCDVFKQNCSSSTQMCTPQQKSSNTCMALGSGVLGTTCFAQGDCSPKLMCATKVGTSGSTSYFGFGDYRGGSCMTLCAPAAPSCPAGTTCSPIMQGGHARTDIGVCSK